MLSYWQKNKAKLSIKYKEWMEKDKGGRRRVCAAGYKYWLAHKEEIKRRNKIYRQKNPGKVSLWHHRRRAAVGGGSHSLEDWNRVRAGTGGLCLGCMKRVGAKGLTKDHIIPVSRGGSGNIENIQPLCGSCNSEKGIDTWRFRIPNIRPTYANRSTLKS